MTLKGKCFKSACTSGSANLRPIRRLASKTLEKEVSIDASRRVQIKKVTYVLCGFIATWFLAASPIKRSESENETYDGVVRLPWSFAIISTRSFCQTPTQLWHQRELNDHARSARNTYE